MNAQVVVVGGGPAGSVTALLLARAGIDVLVLERAHFPRAKPCGDCLSAAAGGLLARLGLLPLVASLAPAELEGWAIHGPRGRGFSARFDELAGTGPGARCALAVPRAAFDAALLSAAAAAGARVEHGVGVEQLVFAGDAVCGVRVRRQGSYALVRAALTIGADGLRSRVARQLGRVARPPRLRKLSLTARLQLDTALPPIGAMYVGAGLCVGVAPVSADRTRCNLTVVADRHRAREVRGDQRAFFERALDAFPELPVALRRAPLGPLLASGPFDRPVRSPIANGAALVGDAAGYFDPFTGQGIFHAMAQAEVLAAVVSALDLGAHPVPASALRPYAAAQRHLTAGPRRVQRLIEGVLSRPATAAAALHAIERRPPLARALLAVTGDLAPARDLLAPAVLRSLIRPPSRTLA